jgi:hypothetical protein
MGTLSFFSFSLREKAGMRVSDIAADLRHPNPSPNPLPVGEGFF